MNAKHVAIYTTRTCQFCKMAKAFFKEHAITYDEKDVTGDEALQEEMITKSGQYGVPVIDIDGELIIGFDEEKLRKVLKIK